MINSEQVLRRDYNEDALGISKGSVLEEIKREFAPEDSLATIGRYLAGGTVTELRQAFQVARGLDLTGRYGLISVRIALDIIQSTPQSSRVATPLIRQRVMADTGFVAAQAALEEAREGRL